MKKTGLLFPIFFATLLSAAPLWAAPADADLVNLQDEIPDAAIEIRYATVNNFANQRLYDDPTAYLRRGTAAKLKKVSAAVAQKGYRLKIWDAYRPTWVQFKMWEVSPDARYVANPFAGFSDHSRGAAVDLTLIDASGRELEMPSGYDEFTPKADRDYRDVTPRQRENALYLEKMMKENGFIPLATEWWHYRDSDSYPVLQDLSLPREQTFPGKTAITISAIGDCILGADPRFPKKGSFYEIYDQNGPDYFFQNVRPIFEADDLTIANLEGTLTTASQTPDKSFQAAAFFFRGDPLYAKILTAGGVEAVNLANNHSMDYLDEGYDETLRSLKKEGVIPFGNGYAQVVSLKGIEIGLVGYTPLGPLEEGVDIAILKKQIKEEIAYLKTLCSVVIVSFHWGDEKARTPNEQQMELGRFAIDNGADLVLGHHPHVLQPIEKYKGKYIVYSLGNFVYGGILKSQVRYSMIYQQTFVFDQGNLEILQPPKVIPVSISGNSSTNDYRPILLYGIEAYRVHKRVEM